MPGRVLIVDDDRSMCEMLEADLRLRDFECAWTTIPRDALQMLHDRVVSRRADRSADARHERDRVVRAGGGQSAATCPWS